MSPPQQRTPPTDNQHWLSTVSSRFAGLSCKTLLLIPLSFPIAFLLSLPNLIYYLAILPYIFLPAAALPIICALIAIATGVGSYYTDERLTVNARTGIILGFLSLIIETISLFYIF